MGDIKIGNSSIDNLYLGANAVDRVYKGSDLVWEANTFAPEEVTIGTQTWMAVNLDVDDGGGDILAYNNSSVYSDQYGYLYTLGSARRIADSIDGWRLPTLEDWQTLIAYTGGANAGTALKSDLVLGGWSDYNNNTNTSNLGITAGGYWIGYFVAPPENVSYYITNTISDTYEWGGHTWYDYYWVGFFSNWSGVDIDTYPSWYDGIPIEDTAALYVRLIKET